jgi:hypothetical protein
MFTCWKGYIYETFHHTLLEQPPRCCKSSGGLGYRTSFHRLKYKVNPEMKLSYEIPLKSVDEDLVTNKRNY